MTAFRVLALLPFLMKEAMPLQIFRAMPDRGVDVTVAFSGTTGIYAPDEMEDFIARDRLIDLSRSVPAESFGIIDNAIKDRGINLVLQVGAAPLYPSLPRWKESSPKLRIADLLFNEFGHTLNHFLYEGCIDGVIVESETMRRYIKRASFKEQPTVELVRSGVDLDAFTPLHRPLSDGSPITVGYIGRMSPEKNPIGFIDLAERLLALDPDLEFRMTGAGPDATEVAQRLVDSPYRNRIVYTGFVNDLHSALHQIDVLILSSKFDGRPAIVMEANACGIPVVAAPVGAVPELIDEGVNGYLLHPENTGPIHDLLSTWKESPKTLTQLRRSAREFACRMFDREQMFDNYARAFRRIAATFDANSVAAG